MFSFRRRLLALFLLWPAAAHAQGCIPATAMTPDGRVLGHLPYGDVAPGVLVEAPAGFALRGCRIRPEVAADLARLLATATADPTTGGTLRGASCHRSLPWQESVFCADPGRDLASRVMSIAPPGHSEHATGYAIDFAIRPAGGCPDVEACMANLPAARWLRLNAPRFGFEQSFPGGNRQGVKWEPWHWRWVGTNPAAPGAARARFVFARARAQYPANPGVP